MAKSLTEIIMATYPGAIAVPPDSPCIVQDNSDGKGPFIAKWDAEKIGAPKPIEADLIAAYRAAHPGE